MLRLALWVYLLAGMSAGWWSVVVTSSRRGTAENEKMDARSVQQPGNQAYTLLH